MMSSRFCTNSGSVTVPRRRIRVARPELQHRRVDMPAGQRGVQPEPVPQQGRAVRDLVGEVVTAAPGAGRRPGGRSRRGVRREWCRPPGSRSPTVLSYTGKRPVFAATMSLYGRVVDVHCGCEAGSVTGTSPCARGSRCPEPAPPGPVGPLDVEPAHPALAHGREQIDLRQIRPQGPLHRAVREVLPAHREHGGLDPRRAVRRLITVPSSASAWPRTGWRSGCPGPA
jgi:hypothetical protein